MTAETNNGPKILSAIRAIVATLVLAGVHDLSRWWWALVERFYLHGTALVLTVCAGRGAIKTITSVIMGIAETVAGGHIVPPGERHYFAHVAENVGEASKTLRIYEEYLRLLGIGFTKSGDTLDLVDLPLGFKIFACRVGAVSGFRVIGWTADECALWDDEGADPSAEVVTSIKGMGITHRFVRGRLFSKPLGTLGFFYEAWRQGDTAAQVAGHASSWEANPGITEAQCRILYPDDVVFDREARAIPQGGRRSAFGAESVLHAFEPLVVDQIVSNTVLGLDPATRGRDRFSINAGAWGMQRQDPDDAFEQEVLLYEDGTPSSAVLIHRDRPKPVVPPTPKLYLWDFRSIDTGWRAEIGITGIVDEIMGLAREVDATMAATDPFEAFSLASLLKQRGLRTEVFSFGGGNGQRTVSRFRQLLNARCVHLQASEAVKAEFLTYEERIGRNGIHYEQGRDPGGGHFDSVSSALQVVRADLEGHLSGSPANRGGTGLQVQRNGVWVDA